MEDQVTTTDNRGRGQAVGSLICGILAFANALDSLYFFLVFIPVILGIISLSLSKKSKALGYEGGMAKAGKVFAILGLIVSIVIFVVEVGILIAASSY